MRKSLNDFEIEEVKKQAWEKLGICRKTGDVIGTQIFSILSIYARVIYYPLGKAAPWGFTRISGCRDDASLEKPFVAINTSIPVDCQVFAAAHELYHIWYEQNPDILPSDLLNEDGKESNEKKANRFAAEFLMDEGMLRQEINTYGTRTFDIKEVLQLAQLFVVPYRAMAKRLYEISVIDEKKMDDLFSVSESEVDQYRKRYAIVVPNLDNRIYIDNLAELSVTAYEQGLITYEKLEYQLSICGLKPEDIGVVKQSINAFPSDEELDRIMEE